MVDAETYTDRLMRNLKVDCDGGCRRLVGIGERNCPDCAELERLFAERMESDRRKMNAFPVQLRPSQPRTDVGTALHRRGDPCRLDDLRITPRERAALFAIGVGVLAAAVWCGWLGHQVIGALHSVGARLVR